MGYDWVSVTSVAGDAHWRVVVNKTFVDVVSEKGPVLTHVSSAPGHLETFSSVDTYSSSALPVAEHGVQSCACDDLEQEVCKDVDTYSSSALPVAEDGVQPCSCDDLEQEVCKDEPTQTGKTAKRNKRRRAQALAAKKADSVFEIDSVGVVTDKKPPTPPGVQKAATTASSPSTQVSASVLKGAKSKNNKKKGDGDGLDTASTASTASTETPCKDDSLAVGTWQGGNPTAAQRAALRSQFFKICCEQTHSRLSEHRSNKLFTSEELATFDCTSDRPLVSVAGDIFDVSSCPERYGPNGIRSFQAGTDITWALLSGYHTKEACDQFYDIFKQTDEGLFASHMMHLCSTIVQFQQEYGAPIGRHSMFANERDLPAPPMDNRADCVVQ